MWHIYLLGVRILRRCTSVRLRVCQAPIKKLILFKDNASLFSLYIWTTAHDFNPNLYDGNNLAVRGRPSLCATGNSFWLILSIIWFFLFFLKVNFGSFIFWPHHTSSSSYGCVLSERISHFCCANKRVCLQPVLFLYTHAYYEKKGLVDTFSAVSCVSIQTNTPKRSSNNPSVRISGFYYMFAHVLGCMTNFKEICKDYSW